MVKAAGPSWAKLCTGNKASRSAFPSTGSELMPVSKVILPKKNAKKSIRTKPRASGGNSELAKSEANTAGSECAKLRGDEVAPDVARLGTGGETSQRAGPKAKSIGPGRAQLRGGGGDAE